MSSLLFNIWMIRAGSQARIACKVIVHMWHFANLNQSVTNPRELSPDTDWYILRIADCCVRQGRIRAYRHVIFVYLRDTRHACRATSLHVSGAEWEWHRRITSRNKIARIERIEPDDVRCRRHIWKPYFKLGERERQRLEDRKREEFSF